MELAKKVFIDLNELSKIHGDNKTIVNFTNFAKSLVLKQGSIKKKGKAISILQNLIEDNKSNVSIHQSYDVSLELLELLFEDFLLSEDEDIIIQIDEIM